MKNIKKAVFAATAIITTGVMGLGVFASSAYTSPAEALAGLTGQTVEEVVAEKTAEDVTYGELAAEAGVLDAFHDAMIELRADRSNQGSGNGTMSQSQNNYDNCDGECDGTGIQSRSADGLNGTANGSGTRAQNQTGDGTGICVNE